MDKKSRSGWKNPLGRALSIALAVLFLAACSVPVVRETLPNFNGKSVDYAVSWLGIPDRQYEFNGNTILEWNNSYAYTYARPRAHMGFGLGSHGYYGGGVGVGIPFGYGDPFGYELERYSQHCQIKLITRKGIVQGHEFEGEDKGCGKYARRLKPLQAQMRPLPPPPPGRLP